MVVRDTAFYWAIEAMDLRLTEFLFDKVRFFAFLINKSSNSAISLVSLNWKSLSLGWFFVLLRYFVNRISPMILHVPIEFLLFFFWQYSFSFCYSVLFEIKFGWAMIIVVWLYNTESLGR